MKNNALKIMVIGSGAWGSALANHLAINNCDVYIVATRQEVVDDINQRHQNPQYLPNIFLHKNIKAGLDIVSDVDYVFIVVPSCKAHLVFQKIAEKNFKKNCCFVICSKGFEENSTNLLSDSFEKINQDKNYAVLSGPNFALEVAKQLPTITTIASSDKKIAKNIIKILGNKNFKALYFKDVKTVEICGIVKNILAIGCGIVDGLELGSNSKAALLAKGIAEIQIICKKIKASIDIANPAGFGDIFLTCSSVQSRNNSLGRLIAQGNLPNKNTTYEGVNSAKIIVEFAKKHKLKLDLCEAINKIINNKYSKNEIKSHIVTAILS